METTRLGSPTGVLVDTIRDVPSVRDLSWAEGSDYITVTTDNKVRFTIDVYNIYGFTNLKTLCLIRANAPLIGVPTPY